jgi:hypothetical protein
MARPNINTLEQCCGSGMFVYSGYRNPDPYFCPSRNPDPKTATEKGVKKISCHTFFCSHKYHKIENYFICEQIVRELFTQIIVIKLSNI